MALDSRSLAWAMLAQKALPQRALVSLLRAFPDPAEILAASAAQLARHVSAAVAQAALAPVAADALDLTRRWLDDPAHHLLPGMIRITRVHCSTSATRRRSSSTSAAVNC